MKTQERSDLDLINLVGSKKLWESETTQLAFSSVSLRVDGSASVPAYTAFLPGGRRLSVSTLPPLPDHCLLLPLLPLQLQDGLAGHLQGAGQALPLSKQNLKGKA